VKRALPKKAKITWKGCQKLFNTGAKGKISLGRVKAKSMRRRAMGVRKEPKTLTLYFKLTIKSIPIIIQAKKERDSWRLVTGVWPASTYLVRMAKVWMANPNEVRITAIFERAPFRKKI
jgi:hypothetical protein